MIQQPKVSIIIPVYNTAAYLRQAIRSVMDQTLSEIEIIIVNDGSADESGNIIRELAAEDSRIIFFEQENRGQSVARNVGLGCATGEFVYFMDSDDLLAKNALESCYDNCKSHDLDFVFFDGDILYEDVQFPLSWDYHRTYRYDESIVYNGISLLDDMLEYATYKAVPWLVLVKRDYLNRIALNFYPGIIHEDELFSVLLFVRSERIGCVKKNLVQHRVHCNSTMGKRYSLHNVNCYFIVLNELFTYAHGHLHVLPLIRKYASYTLNAIFLTASVLSFTDKINMYTRCIQLGYLKYIDIKIQLRFWIKRN